MRLRARALLTCVGCCLLLRAAVRGTQNDPEGDSKADHFLGQETDSLYGGALDIPEQMAEIADVMLREGMDTVDSTVFLSMGLGKVKEDAMRDKEASVCSAENGAECSVQESLLSLVNSLGESQEKSQSQSNGSDAEPPKVEDSNATDSSSKPLKVNCEERNITGVENFTLQILNVSQDLMEFLNPNSSECTLALFYTPWCRFSAGLAPHFNVLPLIFPTLHFVALDASQHSSLSTRFGTVAVPNILLFQGAKPMARFNHTERSLDALKAFIFNQSGIEAKPDVVVTESHCEGPLPCVPLVGIDWLLVFSVLYVIIFILYATLQTESIRWLIPGQEHEHQE